MNRLGSGALALALTLGCAPAKVDYSRLKSAAEARLARAGSGVGKTNRRVETLLKQPLDAEAASQVALLNNRALQATLEDLAVAEARLTQAERLPNPTLEGSIRYGGEDPEIDIAALLNLSTLLLLVSRVHSAQAGVEAAKLEAIGKVVDLAFDARRAFYSYQGALQALELRKSALEALGASAEAAERLHAAGNITDLALTSQQSLYEEARLGFQRAETAAFGARERLNAVMGVWSSRADWRAAGRLPELPSEELDLPRLEDRAVAESLDLAAKRQAFTAAARRANVEATSGWLPELKAGVSAERQERWQVGPAVELEVPLFYQGQGEVAEAEAQMRKEEHAFAHTAVLIRTRAREVGQRLSAARRAVDYYRTVLLPLKARILNETERQYNAMQIGVFQLLQAKRDQLETASAYVAELERYWQARLDAEQLLAGRLIADGGDDVPGDDFEVGAAAPPEH